MTNRHSTHEVRNPAWSIADVHNHYSYGNSHADLYRYLSQWSDLETYLNVGYSSSGQRHLHPSSHLRLIDHLSTHLLALHAAGPHAKENYLLDIASGRGGPAIYAHQRYGLKVLGIDITFYNLELAIHNAREQGVCPQVCFAMGNAQALPLSNGSFSLAWSIESPAHFPDKPAFLREAGRVLKPDGVLAFADLLAVDEVATASVENRRIYDAFLQVWDVPYLESASSYQQAIADTGFELHQAEIITEFNLAILQRYCHWFLRLFQPRLLYHLYKHYIRWRTGADLANVYQHVLTSYQALQLGMIDYGLFWCVRR